MECGLLFNMHAYARLVFSCKQVHGAMHTCCVLLCNMMLLCGRTVCNNVGSSSMAQQESTVCGSRNPAPIRGPVGQPVNECRNDWLENGRYSQNSVM
jgi:hypothetical protein